MANKYSGLSDFEVNKKIARRYKHGGRLTYFNKEKIVYFEKGSIHKNLDYCNDAGDAFKLMIDNEMKLEKIEKWRASSWVNDNSIVSSSHENPCRAIAECFLLMKDAENE